MIKMKRFEVRFRGRKEGRIKEILEDESTRTGKSMNTIVIEALEEHYKRTQQELPLEKIDQIINEELINLSSRTIPSYSSIPIYDEDVTLEEWFTRLISSEEKRREFILRWVTLLKERDRRLTKTFDIDQEEINEKWEQYLKGYRLITALHKIDQDALERMFFEYLNEYFTLKKIELHSYKNKIFAALVPRQEYVTNEVFGVLNAIIFEILENSPLSHESKKWYLLSITLAISPVFNLMKLQKGSQTRYTSMYLLNLISLLFREQEKTVEIFESDFYRKESLLFHILTEYRERDLEPYVFEDDWEQLCENIFSLACRLQQLDHRSFSGYSEDDFSSANDYKILKMNLRSKTIDMEKTRYKYSTEYFMETLKLKVDNLKDFLPSYLEPLLEDTPSPSEINQSIEMHNALTYTASHLQRYFCRDCEAVFFGITESKCSKCGSKNIESFFAHK